MKVRKNSLFNWNDKKIDFNLVILNGISENLNNQNVNGIVFDESNQLKNNYYLFSSIITKKVANLPLRFTLEPEYLINRSQFIQNNIIFKSSVYNLLVGLKINFNLNKKIILNSYSKYTNFILYNNRDNNTNTFNFITNIFKMNYKAFNENFLFDFEYKQVNFLQKNYSFNNLNFSISYPYKKAKYYFNVHNLLNSKNFFTKEFEQSLLLENSNSVFGRYINFGLEFKVN